MLGALKGFAVLYQCDKGFLCDILRIVDIFRLCIAKLYDAVGIFRKNAFDMRAAAEFFAVFFSRHNFLLQRNVQDLLSESLGYPLYNTI